MGEYDGAPSSFRTSKQNKTAVPVQTCRTLYRRALSQTHPLCPPLPPPSLLPTSHIDSPETKAATASALTLSPLSLNARKMARLAAAVVEDDMRTLYVCVGRAYECPNAYIAVLFFCGDSAKSSEACVRASFHFSIPSFGADLPISSPQPY